MRTTMPLGVCAFVSLCAPALGQSGMIDQVSPRTNASYNLDAPSLLWQQQVRAGVAGQLEGLSISILGPMGAEFTLAVRLGDAPSSNPVLFTARVVKATSDPIETRFIDMSASNIVLALGEAFVMETLGNGTGANLLGSYVDPAKGPPLYPEPLYLNGTPYPPGWRHGFTSYMLGSACLADFNADGMVNVQDFLAYLSAFDAGDPRADFNGDGMTNVQDFLAFLSAYAAGCP